jgi:hypothetical protein
LKHVSAVNWARCMAQLESSWVAGNLDTVESGVAGN